MVELLDYEAFVQARPATVSEAWAATIRFDHVFPIASPEEAADHDLADAGVIWVGGERARPLRLAIEEVIGVLDEAFDCLSIAWVGLLVVVRLRPRGRDDDAVDVQLKALTAHPDSGLAWRVARA